jgi:hypothetical protein
VRYNVGGDYKLTISQTGFLLATYTGTDAVRHSIATATKIPRGQTTFGKSGNTTLHHAIIHTGFVVVGIYPTTHSHTTLTGHLFFS